MKKNENKGLIKVIIILVVLIIIGNILNMAFAKEEVKEPEGKLTNITVWLTEKNGKDWNDARTEIEEAIMEEYGTFETELIHVHNDETRIYWIDLTYETEGGTVTGRIYDHR